MKPVHTFPRIATDETLRETVSHGSLDYLFQYYLENVWEFDLHCIDWHWHPELEMIYVNSGETLVSIGGEQVPVPEGCGMLINGRMVHRFQSERSTWMPNIVFSPALLAPEGSLIYRRYVQPLLEGGFSYCLFDPQITWHGEVLRLLRMIFSDHEKGDVSQLRTLRLLLEMWEIIVSHVEISPASGSSRRTGEQARLQMMLQFIQDHYREPITLQRIADSIYISKSSALQIFHEGIHQSPVAYLINYRLNCAAQQLRTTERTVAAIAADTGFSSAGYFCRRFRKLYGVTPQQYRSR